MRKKPNCIQTAAANNQFVTEALCRRFDGMDGRLYAQIPSERKKKRTHRHLTWMTTQPLHAESQSRKVDIDASFVGNRDRDQGQESESESKSVWGRSKDIL